LIFWWSFNQFLNIHQNKMYNANFLTMNVNVIQSNENKRSYWTFCVIHAGKRLYMIILELLDLSVWIKNREVYYTAGSININFECGLQMEKSWVHLICSSYFGNIKRRIFFYDMHGVLCLHHGSFTAVDNYNTRILLLCIWA
jgi:hypothetical protein